jgi:hypothetical protein
MRTTLHCVKERSLMIAAIYARTVLAWLPGAVLLAGCVTHGRLDGTLPRADPQTAAEIAVIREWRFIGGGANLIVLLNGAPLYGISVDEHGL